MLFQDYLILQRYESISVSEHNCAFPNLQNFYEIDLDSVYYDNPHDKRPVYKLAKTDMSNRNRFQVVIQVVFQDNSLSGEFTSPAFYCCTQPKSNMKRKARSTNGTYKIGC